MRITGRSFAVVCVGLGLVIAGPGRGAEETSFSTLSQLATAFSENDSDAAMQQFDRAMKGYADIESNVEALTAQDDITCALDVVTDDESGGTHTLDVDWYFNLKSQTNESLTEQRRQRVQIQMRLIKGHWRITALSPASILAPLTVH